jgi:xanthine dehydrogenase accessory factor
MTATVIIENQTDRLVVVHGVGTVGSAVAHGLFQAGYPVVIVEDRRPTTLRWRMSFAAALAQGHCRLEGVEARRVDSAAAALRLLADGAAIPVLAGSLAQALAALRPSVLIDAKVKAPAPARIHRGSAPLTIGIGPRFDAGRSVDVVIESRWGAGLGRAIHRGRADLRPCHPELIDDLGWERFVAAPADGRFERRLDFGSRVRPGEIIGRIAGRPLRATLGGVIRGLPRDGSAVRRGDKVVEIDPRLDAPQVEGLGLRAGKIARAALEVIADFAQRPRPAETFMAPH